MVVIWLLGCTTPSTGPTGDPAAHQQLVARLGARIDGEPGPTWTPDVRLDLSPSAFQTLVTGAFHRKSAVLQGVVEFNGARLTNEARVVDVDLKPDVVPCGDKRCFELQLELTGVVAATTSEGAGDATFHAQSTVQFTTGVREVHGTREVYATTYGVALDVLWEHPEDPLNPVISGPAKQWLGKKLIDTPDLVLARSQQEPLARAVRSDLRDGGLTVELLTDRTAGGLAPREDLPNKGFLLTTTHELFVGLATSWSFERKARRDLQIVAMKGNTHGMDVDTRSWSASDGVWTDHRLRSRIDLEPPWRPSGPLNDKRKQQAAKHTRIRLITPEWTETTREPAAPADIPQSTTTHTEAALTWAAGVALPDITGVPSAPTRRILTGLTSTPESVQITGELP